MTERTRGYLPEIVRGQNGIRVSGSAEVIVEGEGSGAVFWVPTPPDLASIPDQEGRAVALVVSLDEHYEYLPGDLTPADGVTVVATPGGRWKIFGLDSYTQQEWFVDPVGGSDANVGDTGLNPLLTVEEFVRRTRRRHVLLPATGTYLQVNVPMTLSLMNDFSADSPVHLSPRMGPEGSLRGLSVKAPTVLHTGVFTTVNAITPGSNVGQIVEDLTLVNWAGLVNGPTGQAIRIRITGGPNEGAVAYPEQDLGLSQVRTSPFTVPQSSAPVASTVVLQPNAGDPFVVETDLVEIADFLVDVEASSTNQNSDNVRLLFNGIAVSNEGPRRAVVQYTGSADAVGDVYFSGCDVGRVDARACRVVCDNCKVSGLQSEVRHTSLAVSAGLVTQQMTVRAGARASFSSHAMFGAGGRLLVEGEALSTALSVFDSGGDGIELLPGGTMRTTETPPYGASNGLLGVRLRACSHLVWQGNKPTITGNQGDLAIEDVEDVWAQFGDDLVDDARQAGISRTL